MHGVVGFSPGVFDLFHIGHLDVLRRAAESCDRLIAGVLTDELAERLHGARPIVPLIERMEIVGAVGHVDRVVPLGEPGLRAAWQAQGFDVLFTSDADAFAPGEGEHGLAGTGVRVVRFDGTARTASAVLREALATGAGTGDERRTSVA